MHSNKATFALLLVTLVPVLLSGCRSNELKNIIDYPIMGSGNQSEKDVRRIILKACKNLGWRTKQGRGREIIASYQRGNRMLIVRIKYSAKSYSIFHMDSSNIKNTKKGRAQYHSLVKKLSSHIRSLSTGL